MDMMNCGYTCKADQNDILVSGNPTDPPKTCRV